MHRYEEALWVHQKVLDDEHPLTATTLHNMAGVLVEQGKYEEAMQGYEEVLRVQQKVFGDEHPSTAGTLHNMAGVFK